MEDPPEINDFIRELGGSLAQEAGAAPASGLPLPRCGQGSAGKGRWEPAGCIEVPAVIAAGL